MHVEEAFATRRFSSSVTAHSTNPTVRPLWVATSGRPNASGTGEGDTGPQNPLPVFRSCLFAEPARRLTSSLRSGCVGFARIAPFMTQTCAFFSTASGSVCPRRVSPFLGKDHQRDRYSNEREEERGEIYCSHGVLAEGQGKSAATLLVIASPCCRRENDTWR